MEIPFKSCGYNKKKIAFAQVIIFLFIATLCNIKTVYGQIGLDAQPKTINLGEIYSNSIPRIQFVLSNLGKDKINIYAINTFCGCSEVHKFKKILLPGEQDTVEIVFNTFGFRGHINKSVEIISDDKNSSVIKLYFSATIVADLETSFIGDVYWVGNIKLDSTSTFYFYLKNNSDNDVLIENIIANNISLKLHPEKNNLSKKDSVKVNVSINPSDLGLSSEEFIIVTNNNKQPKLKLAITFFVSK
ncbi:MAG: DUF1573 domain-containing protein [Bacteroidota bacterium]